MAALPRRLKRGQRQVEIRTTGDNPRVLTRYVAEGYFSRSEIESAGREWVSNNRPDVNATALEFRYYPEFPASQTVNEETA